MDNIVRKTVKPLKSTLMYEIKRRNYSPFTIFLFLLIAVYAVLPFIDIPLLGLSMSAPVFFLVAMEVFFRPPEPWFANYRLWINLAILIFVGILSSVLGSNLLTLGSGFESSQVAGIVRYAYWLLVFVVTAYFVSYTNLWWRLLRWLAIAVIVLALLRWYEVFAFGKIGAEVGTLFMTQNSYGALFSTFASMLLPFVVVGRKRFLVFLAIMILWGALAINGSRGSWIGVSISTLVFFFVFLRSRTKVLRGIVALLGLLLLFLVIFNFAPDQWIRPVEERFSTFQSLNEDKTYVIRQVLMRKGLSLFQANPIFGVGLSHFQTNTIMDVSVPDLLKNRAEEILSTKTAHNSYILLLAETGLVGTLPFAIMIIILMIEGYKSVFHLSRQNEFWAPAIYSGFIGMSIHYWVVVGITNTVSWMMYGLVAGMIWFSKAKLKEGRS